MLTIVLLAAFGGVPAHAPETVDVAIYLDDRTASSELLGPGRLAASEIFRKIGVRLDWRTGEPPAADNGAPAFAIRAVEHAPAPAGHDALAMARLVTSGAAEVTIYADRVRCFLAQHPSQTGAPAAYVLAHELAHAMQGEDRHSESGILKRHWDEADFHEMIWHHLVFTSTDVDLIHSGLLRSVNAVGRRQRGVVLTTR